MIYFSDIVVQVSIRHKANRHQNHNDNQEHQLNVEVFHIVVRDLQPVENSLLEERAKVATSSILPLIYFGSLFYKITVNKPDRL